MGDKTAIHDKLTDMSAAEVVRSPDQENFWNGLETDGAAFALYRDGELVVDIWGGYADFDSLKKWEKDTMGMWFSTTKAVIALCIALLVDRKLMDYDDLVIKHWPEFGSNGKINITVQMILSHKAGLAALDEEVTLEIARDWKALSKILEKQKPYSPPGQRRIYHAFTFGWLMDQIVRRVDPQHRGIGRFFSEEIAKPHGKSEFSGFVVIGLKECNLK
ncbi:unnamed protein product [Soboliphyme baturini]|uniref:Beta-lactamase domain-containing protein n=1 Tax=Soboliphyme baturini TaxID=241478 RepID=A0A183J257_9BILA|nr:unnamed protein product [Soboliphyme baturini]